MSYHSIPPEGTIQPKQDSKKKVLIEVIDYTSENDEKNYTGMLDEEKSQKTKTS